MCTLVAICIGEDLLVAAANRGHVGAGLTPATAGRRAAVAPTGAAACRTAAPRAAARGAALRAAAGTAATLGGALATLVATFSGLSRFFWHPSLAYSALWLLATALISLLLIAP